MANWNIKKKNGDNVIFSDNSVNTRTEVIILSRKEIFSMILLLPHQPTVCFWMINSFMKIAVITTNPIK